MALSNSDAKPVTDIRLPKIVIKSIESIAMRYKTLGDWYFEQGQSILCIVVAKQQGPDAWKKEYLIALHELVEVMQCLADGITQKQVDDFDMGISESQVKADGYTEHGFHPKAPYKKQHCFAFLIEQLAARELGIDAHDLIYGDLYDED